MATIERATSSPTTGLVSTVDLTHTIPAGVNCLAVVVPYDLYPPGNRGPVSSITWDVGGAAEALTYIGATTFNTWGIVELWIKWNPTAGSAKTLRTSFPNSLAEQIQFVAFNLQDVDQTATGTPIKLENVGNGGASGDKTVTFSAANGAASVAGDIILGGWYDDQGFLSTLSVLNSPDFGAIYEDVGSGDSDGAAHAWEVAAADKVVGYNLTNTNNGDWELGAWLFKGQGGLPPHARDFSAFIPIYHRLHNQR